MEKKEEKIFRDIVKILEQDVPQEALAEGNPTPEQEAIALIKQELDKAREEGIRETLEEVLGEMRELEYLRSKGLRNVVDIEEVYKRVENRVIKLDKLKQ